MTDGYYIESIIARNRTVCNTRREQESNLIPMRYEPLSKRPQSQTELLAIEEEGGIEPHTLRYLTPSKRRRQPCRIILLWSPLDRGLQDAPDLSLNACVLTVGYTRVPQQPHTSLFRGKVILTSITSHTSCY